MDIYAFNCLSRNSKVALVWQYGWFLAIRQKMNCSVVLYYMGGCFAEVWYSPDDNQIRLGPRVQQQKALRALPGGTNLEERLE
jgi:hypothetical protein